MSKDYMIVHYFVTGQTIEFGPFGRIDVEVILRHFAPFLMLWAYHSYIDETLRYDKIEDRIITYTEKQFIEKFGD